METGAEVREYSAAGNIKERRRWKMKKIISLLVILVMVLALGACSKDEPKTDTKENETTKAAEETSKPESKPESEPASDPEEAPSDPDDEFSSAGHAYEGIWQSGDCVLAISPEGAADVITVYSENTDKETFGSWQEFPSNYDEAGKRFVSPVRNIYSIVDGYISIESDESEYIFEVAGDNLLWAEMTFEKTSDDTADNPYLYDMDAEPVELEVEHFGSEFTKESLEAIDVVATTYYGVFCEDTNDPDASYYYPYIDDVYSMETMDEFVAAFLDLGVEEDQGHLCFLDTGKNEDVNWTMENGSIRITGNYSNAIYTGDFYWDAEGQKLYVCVHIDGYNVWMVSGQ